MRRRGPRSQIAKDRRARRASFMPCSPSSSVDGVFSLPSTDGLCESRPSSVADFSEFDSSPHELTVANFPFQLSILQANIRGWLSHRDEFVGHIAFLEFPTLLFLNETLLNESIAAPEIPNYELIGRYEDVSTKRGVAVFALKAVAPDIVVLLKSPASERIWLLLHSHVGPVLLCCWYRRPCRGEVDSVITFRAEYNALKTQALSTIIVGDLNVHQVKWLRFSSGNTPEGDVLQAFCEDYGFREYVRAPTRGEYLLDVILSDVQTDVVARVLPGVSDHSMVLATFDTKIQWNESTRRQVWLFHKANWKHLSEALLGTDWSWIAESMPDDAAEKLQEKLLELMRQFIPNKSILVRSGSHPWLNEDCLALIKEKRAAWGTPAQGEASSKCSRGMLDQFYLYVDTVKTKLSKLKRGSKAWWKISKQLMMKSTSPCSIPALRHVDGKTWARTKKEKAELLVDTFAKKWVLPEPHENTYSFIPETSSAPDTWIPIRARHALRFLSSLNESSATGPDNISARVLRQLAPALALPFTLLARSIVHHGRWPDVWITHWICAMHKRKSLFEPGNYRGLQLTAQISKAMERFLASLFLPDLINMGGFGTDQFAYRPQHGSRDVILLLVVMWLLLLAAGQRIGLYCSDVQGAFDRVTVSRLVSRLKRWQVHPKLLGVIESWLRPRKASVVVGGEKSNEFVMSNMVYQGTVWGPPLWNVFFADAPLSLSALGFENAVFADDLNSFKAFPQCASDSSILCELKAAQHELHSWGGGNQVIFDPGKESFHIISRQRPLGEEFVLLGIHFDCKLLMHKCVSECVTSCGWKLESILRPRRFFSTGELVQLFKSHILSFIEYRTPGVYHASPSVLLPIDKMLQRFLRQMNIGSLDALLHFNLAPLATRRDIAMLGAIHRSVLGYGPLQLQQFFVLSEAETRFTRYRHRRNLHDVCDRSNCPTYLKRSVLGLIAIYNVLPEYVVLAPTVKRFQHCLQDIVKYLAVTGYPQWQTSLNRCTFRCTVLPRVTLHAVKHSGSLLPAPRLQSH